MQLQQKKMFYRSAQHADKAVKVFLDTTPSKILTNDRVIPFKSIQTYEAKMEADVLLKKTGHFGKELSMLKNSSCAL